MHRKHSAYIAGLVGAALVLSSCPVLAACLATPVQDANPSNGTRTGIAEPASNYLWVSGTISLGLPATLPYIERFDPRAGWTTTVFSMLARSAFTSVAAFSTQQAMVVGYKSGGTDALAMALNGSQWTLTLGGSGQPRLRGSLQKVVAVPHTSTAYAVLAYGRANLVFWNGVTWTTVLDAFPPGSILSVSASSPDNIWAVGGTTSSYGVVHGRLERYDGHQWIVMRPPAALTLLTGVDARTADDAWVTGLTQQGSAFAPFAAHWNGHVWATVSLPLQRSAFATYGDTYAQSSSNVWMSAAQWEDGGSLTSLWHWNGIRWRFVTGSVGWSAAPVLAGMPDDVWFAAGAYRRAPSLGNKWVGMATCPRGLPLDT